MHTRRTMTALVAVAATVALLAGCGDDDDEAGDTVVTTATPPASTTVGGASTTTEPAGTEPETTATETTEDVSTTVEPTTVSTSTSTSASVEATTTTTAVAADPIAIWPAADVVLATPEDAAEDFVLNVLGEGPTLGEFQQGDSRSGEIVLLSPGEGTNPIAAERGVILLRQMGPDDGWFVIGVANDEASITNPASGASVLAASLTVEGVGHGFEANLVARALIAGDADSELDLEVTTAGTMEEPGPYSVELDLSAASPGDVIMVIVNTGAGLETDPGEVGAIAVVIAG